METHLIELQACIKKEKEKRMTIQTRLAAQSVYHGVHLPNYNLDGVYSDHGLVIHRHVETWAVPPSYSR